MTARHILFTLLTLLGAMTSLPSASAGDAHEMYARKDNTNRSVACGVCEARGGYLARRPALDDWEIQFGNWSHLQTMDFWVDLAKADNGYWYWGDQVQLNTSYVSALPMTTTYSTSYTDWNCALWNMAEPFLMPADCSIAANILCQIPTSEPDCFNSLLTGMKLNDSTPSLTTDTGLSSLEECNASCSTSSNCWAADWTDTPATCRTLNSATRPAVPDLEPSSGHTTIGRTCQRYEEMSEEDSDFVCNCGAIEIPETEEEKEQFLQEHKEEVEKELIVPTDTLSATIRKKESAPDERTSSTSIGFLGVTLMVVVFGGLVLMDLTSLFAHIKMAASNVKAVMLTGEEAASDA